MRPPSVDSVGCQVKRNMSIREFMVRSGAIAVVALLSGCLTTANESAREIGKPVGKLIKVPASASQGIADGIAGEDKRANPYNR